LWLQKWCVQGEGNRWDSSERAGGGDRAGDDRGCQHSSSQSQLQAAAVRVGRGPAAIWNFSLRPRPGGSAAGATPDCESTERPIDGTAPRAFLCSQTGSVMTDLVDMPDGFTYERRAITHWLGTNAVSRRNGTPMTVGQAESEASTPDSGLTCKCAY
jgi:hypothetical protein